jgi:hypothetical protein
VAQNGSAALHDMRAQIVGLDVAPRKAPKCSRISHRTPARPRQMALPLLARRFSSEPMTIAMAQSCEPCRLLTPLPDGWSISQRLGNNSHQVAECNNG